MTQEHRPCQADPRLFDRTDPASHAAAKAICQTCPALDWCRGELQRELARGTPWAQYPEGTWAGQLLINGHYDNDTCANGHPRSEENTYTRPDGGRSCRPCATARDLRRRVKRTCPDCQGDVQPNKRYCETCRTERRRQQIARQNARTRQLRAKTTT